MVNIMMNLAILTPPFLLAIWYPQVGTVASLGGSFATMLVVYFLPIVTYLKFKHSAITNPDIAQLIQRSTYVTTATVGESSDSAKKSPMSSVLEV